jgi:hypothetical protein
MKKMHSVTIGILCLLLCALPAGAAEEEAGVVAHDSETATDADGQSDGKVSDDKDDGELPLTAGYDKTAMNGFFIRSKDESFRLNIGAYTQARYDVNWRDAPAGEDDVTSGFSIRRTRFFFEGNYTPKFNYHLRMQIDNEGDFSLLIAWMQVNFGKDKRWSLRAGRQFLALSREDWQFAQDTLTTDYSPNDDTFAIGSSIGAQVNFTGERQRFWAAVSNGAFGGKSTFPDNDPSDIAVTGRWEYQLVGTDWSVWDDLIGRRGRARGMLLGIAGGYEDKGSDPMSDPTAIDSGTQLNLDLSFNGDGYQAMVAGSITWREPQTGDSYYNYGILVQGGYFFTEKMQVYGQYNLISPGDQPGALDDFHSITAGVSYFPFVRTNRWKFSGELGYLFDAINNTLVAPSGTLGWLSSDEDGQLYFRIQAQFGF